MSLVSGRTSPKSGISGTEISRLLPVHHCSSFSFLCATEESALEFCLGFRDLVV